MSEKLVLIDGHSILNRAFYGVPDLTNSEGIHTNAMYGFLNIMFKILDEEKADYLTVAFDLSAPTFRHKMYDMYKGTRKPMPGELKQQVPLMKEILQSMGVTIVEKEGFEADDLLGTIAKRSAAEGKIVSVVSGDRDLLQLADENIKIRIPKTKKGVTEIEDYNTQEVVDAYHVSPIEFIDVKALMGDASDNIPGAPGIGEKTATALIAKYKSIENAYAHIEEVTPNKARTSLSENYEQVQMSKVLATIDIDVPIEYSLESAKIDNFYTKEAYEYFKRFNFKSMIKRFDDSNKDTELDLYEYFKTIEDFSEVEQTFAKLMKMLKNDTVIGLSLLVEEDQLFGASLTYGDQDSIYIPVQGFVSEAYILDKLAELTEELANMSGYYGKVTVLKLKQMLPKLGKCNYKVLADAEIAAYLLNPLKDSYEYDEIARDFLGISVLSKQEILGKMSIQQTAFVNMEGIAKMSCIHSYVMYKSWTVISDKLKETQMYDLYNTMEMPLLFVLYEMEQAGIEVNKQGLKEYGDKLATRIAELEIEIYSAAGEEFNINSPKQLGVILFEKLELPNGKKTKSGYSTAADVLEKLAEDHPIVKLILEYRQLTKLKSTYADGLATYIGEDNRIHGKFNQTITATGRISSTEPNLQNIPIRMELGREIRKVFIPKEGCVLIDADYSQIELRILADMSGDETLIQAYNSAQDIHRITASQVFHTPINEVTKEQRSNAKAVNFGIIYGISSFGLSQDLSISRKEANEYIAKYFEAYPSIKAFIDGLVAEAKEKGYSNTMFHRRRPIPELSSSNFMQRAFGERIAMNAPIQGTAADIIKVAMIHVNQALKANNLKSKLILQVHDELLIEAYKDEIEQVKEILENNMKNAADLKVVLEIDMNVGDSWFEAH